MNCGEAKREFALLLYGELSFDGEEALESHLDGCVECRLEIENERALHAHLADSELVPSAGMLALSREQLRRKIVETEASPRSWWRKLLQGFSIHVHPIPAGLQPVGAVALIAMGFFGARMLPPSILGRHTANGDLNFNPSTSRVRYVEPGQAGKVQLVVEDTRQHILSGELNDQNIQALLLSAARDSDDEGLRVESVELLRKSNDCPRVRDALLNALRHDTNPGVRLKALDGLKNMAGDPRVREALTHVLLTDTNSGVRTQAIDLLIQQKQDSMVGVLQELMRKEDNGYVRMRCQKALHDMKASVETY